VLRADPFSGAAFVFRNRRATAIKILLYDGQGFWLAHKRLSAGRFRWWPSAEGTEGGTEGRGARLRAHELQVLLFGGDPRATKAPPEWRRVEEEAAAAVRS
jgi:hypothetical protein